MKRNRQGASATKRSTSLSDYQQTKEIKETLINVSSASSQLHKSNIESNDNAIRRPEEILSIKEPHTINAPPPLLCSNDHIRRVKSNSELLTLLQPVIQVPSFQNPVSASSVTSLSTQQGGGRDKSLSFHSPSTSSRSSRQLINVFKTKLSLVKDMESKYLTKKFKNTNKNSRKRIYSVDYNANVLRLLFTEDVEDNADWQDLNNNKWDDHIEDCNTSKEDLHKTILSLKHDQSKKYENFRRTRISTAFALICAIYFILMSVAISLIWNFAVVTMRLKEALKICYNKPDNITVCW
ncbi:hypothetical protein GJ496_000232 [Pomphorhynchus laevis]|nr:hypothetical protein GJ496_000232 [Pomphorhynchus laevis]